MWVPSAKIKKADVSKKEFRTRCEHDEFLMMSFGLRDGSDELRVSSLARYNHDCVLVDILIYYKNQENNAEDLRVVL